MRYLRLPPTHYNDAQIILPNLFKEVKTADKAY